MRDCFSDRSFALSPGLSPGPDISAQTAYKEPISLSFCGKKHPVAAKNYFIKDIPDMSSKIFSSAKFFCRRL